jgi:hypothetical protein
MLVLEPARFDGFIFIVRRCFMDTNLSAAEFRCWAEQGDRRSKDPMISGEEHERLAKMRDGLLAVANTQEWLEGRSLKAAA